MNRKTALLSLAIALVMGVLMACSLVSSEKSFAATHPQALGAGRPVCSECHGAEAMKGTFKSYDAYNHTPEFVRNHKAAANQDSATCAACHGQSFCADCHGGKGVMTPSTKLGNRPDRAMPHKAGYLSLHRIEGRMDPTSCYKCHGRANNEKCTVCHK